MPNPCAGLSVFIRAAVVGAAGRSDAAAAAWRRAQAAAYVYSYEHTALLWRAPRSQSVKIINFNRDIKDL